MPPLLNLLTAPARCRCNLPLKPAAVFCRRPLIAVAVTRPLDIIISFLGTSPRKCQEPPCNSCVLRSATSSVGFFGQL
jgi:hypothetical protein